MIDFLKLQQLLEREIDHCTVLESLLLLERKQIETNEIEALPKVLQQKADLLSSIEFSQTQLNSWLAANGLPLHFDAFKQSISEEVLANQTTTPQSRDTVQTCLDLWLSLQDAKNRCNESNKVNGIVISKSVKRNGERLAIMKGLNIGKGLYDSSGKEIRASRQKGQRIA